MQEWWLGAPTERSAAKDNMQVVGVQLRKHPQPMESWAVHGSQDGCRTGSLCVLGPS
jgi:hypothetical protein